MAKIYQSKELAQKATENNLAQSVLISAQLRKPTRYPTVLVPSNVFSNLTNLPEQYREVLRSLLVANIEQLIRESLTEGLENVSDDKLTESSLLSSVVTRSGGKLSKEQFMTEFYASVLGKMVTVDKIKRPSIAAKMIATVSSLFSAKAAATLGSAQIEQILTVLNKPQFSVDSSQTWYTQALASIEEALNKSVDSTIEEAY